MNWDLMYEAGRNKQFRWGATLPIAWKTQARTLKHAADRLYDIYYAASERDIARLLEEVEKARLAGEVLSGSRELVGQELADHWDLQLRRVYRLLMGYSLENLLKAILMLKEPHRLREETGVLRIQTHDMVQICGWCQIGLSDDERSLLQALSAYVIWMGKYPVPLDRENMPPFKASDGSWDSPTKALEACDEKERLDGLWLRLLTILTQEEASRS